MALAISVKLLQCCFSLNADQTTLAKGNVTQSLPVLSNRLNSFALGLFWQPAAHYCHALLGIKKKESKFTWTVVMLLRKKKNKSIETAVCK